MKYHHTFALIDSNSIAYVGSFPYYEKTIIQQIYCAIHLVRNVISSPSMSTTTTKQSTILLFTYICVCVFLYAFRNVCSFIFTGIPKIIHTYIYENLCYFSTRKTAFFECIMQGLRVIAALQLSSDNV